MFNRKLKKKVADLESGLRAWEELFPIQSGFFSHPPAAIERAKEYKERYIYTQECVDSKLRDILKLRKLNDGRQDKIDQLQKERLTLEATIQEYKLKESMLEPLTTWEVSLRDGEKRGVEAHWFSGNGIFKLNDGETVAIFKKDEIISVIKK